MSIMGFKDSGIIPEDRNQDNNNIDTEKELKKQVLGIADYLDCNGPELWSEMSKLIAKEVVKELENVASKNGAELKPSQLVANYLRTRLSELKSIGGDDVR